MVMTESDFRFKHSELIENYQNIEMRLKFICAEFIAKGDQDWFDRLDDYETDSLGQLIKNCKKKQQEKHINVFDDDDFTKLEEIRKTRNYWAHQCFGGKNPIVFKNEMLKRNEYAEKIISDLDEARFWDNKLTEIGKKLRELKTEEK